MVPSYSYRIGEDLWETVLAWYSANGRHHLPWRHCRTPWRVMMVEALLRRTRASLVADVFVSLDSEFSGPGEVVQKQATYRAKIKRLGLTARSSLFIRACEALVEQYGGCVPMDPKKLLSLPGVGHYSRDAVFNFGFGEPRYLIDANMIRVAARFGGVDIDQTHHRSKAVRAVVSGILGSENRMTPDRNFALLDLAAIVCTPKYPKCEVCPLRGSCYYLSRKPESQIKVSRN